MALPTRTGFVESARTIGTIEALTYEYRLGEITDLVHKADPLQDKLWAKGTVSYEGDFIRGPIIKDKNPTAEVIQPGGHVSIVSYDPIRTHIWDTVLFVANVTSLLAEKDRNWGPPQIKDAVNVKVDATVSSLRSLISEYLAGPLADGFHGIREILDMSATGYNSGTWTGYLGGINRATETYWRPKVRTLNSLSTGTYLLNEMGKLWRDVSEFGPLSDKETPDIIVTDNVGFGFYTDAYQQGLAVANTVVRYKTTVGKNDDLAVSGPRYNGVPVIWTPGWPGDQQSTEKYRMDFLNLDYMPFGFIKSKTFRRTKWKEPADQVGDSMMQIFMRGQWYVTGYNRLGTLIQIGQTG